MYYVNENIKDLYRVKFHEQRAGVLRLDMNENPEGLPEEIVHKVSSNISSQYIAKYPEKDRLMELLADHNHIASSEPAVTEIFSKAI